MRLNTSIPVDQLNLYREREEDLLDRIQHQQSYTLSIDTPLRMYIPSKPYHR
jgi:hypothetical protein